MILLAILAISLLPLAKISSARSTNLILSVSLRSYAMATSIWLSRTRVLYPCTSARRFDTWRSTTSVSCLGVPARTWTWANASPSHSTTLTIWLTKLVVCARVPFLNLGGPLCFVSVSSLIMGLMPDPFAPMTWRTCRLRIGGALTSFHFPDVHDLHLWAAWWVITG